MIRAAARSIRPVVRLWALAYLRAALRSVHPLHQDVPYIVSRIHAWENAK